MELPLVLSASPDDLSYAESLTDTIEVKLDWKHTEALSTDTTLSTACDTQGISPDSISSIHLPPGTTQPQAMSIAEGNTGTIIDFLHRGLGDNVDPDWLTVHTTRTFDYREHVDRLATITETGGYPLAVENTPDSSFYYSPEDIAALAFLTEAVPRLDDVSILIDTAHVEMDRQTLAVDESALAAVLERADQPLREQLSDRLEAFLEENIDRGGSATSAGIAPPPQESPWRPVFVTMSLVGGSHIQAIHLNDPRSDGLPDTDPPAAGLRWVLSYCQDHDIAVVLEPGDADRESIADTIAGLPFVG